MFKLDDNLLKELGLGSLPPSEKNKMLAHIYETLEMRVGMTLAEKMTSEQLDEFERFIDGNLDYAKGYLNVNMPGWEQLPDYQSQRSGAEQQGRPGDSIIPEFAALKWLEKNFPDYKGVVADELEKLKNEIKSVAPQIVSAAQQQESLQQQPPQSPSA